MERDRYGEGEIDTLPEERRDRQKEKEREREREGEGQRSSIYSFRQRWNTCEV